jgi:hypothetical protein
MKESASAFVQIERIVEVMADQRRVRSLLTRYDLFSWSRVTSREGKHKSERVR